MSNFWENQNWEAEDPHFLGMKAMPFQRDLMPFPKKKGLYILRGPRQIGKSSWLKSMLSYSQKEGQSVFYLSCENVTDHKELSEILEANQKTQVILFDEITFVKEWHRAIKHFVDSGKHHILICSGSHVHDLKKGADQMPGRFGAGGEMHLLPMDFFEFVESAKKAKVHHETHADWCELYFKTGGFPIALAERIQSNSIKNSMDTYQRWLIGDVLRFGKQEIYLRELIGQIGKTMGSPISLQSLARKTQIASHHTIQDYISILESCFALKTLYAIDLNEGSFRFRKDKKFYFTDPMIFWISQEWSGCSAESAMEKMAESTAHEFLSRKFPRLGYLHTPLGEVDFYLHQKFAIEVKWSNTEANLSKAYRNLPLGKKRVWNKNSLFLDPPAQEN